MTLRGSSNINFNSPDYFFHKAIIEIIETTTDNRNIEINDFKIDADNVITINFNSNNEEMIIYFPFEYVEYVLKKYLKEKEKEKNEK